MDTSKVTVSFDAASLRIDTAEDAEQICDAMRKKGDQLEILILQGNSFGIEGAERVGLQLAKHPNLKEAHFKDLFTTRGREQVPVALDHLLTGIIDSDAKLTLLDLSDNAIGPIGAPSVIKFLQSSSAETIERLYVNNCGWGPEGSTSLSSVLHRLRHLHEFVCGRSRLENKGSINISKALSGFSKLQVLRLNQNGIEVKGISEIVKVLESNSESLVELDLSDNTIKPEGCELLFGPISKAKKLKRLILSDALLQNQGFSMICDALSKSASLKNLEFVNFEGNELKGNRVIDLIECTFADCNDTFELDLLDNEFTKEQRQRIRGLRSTSIMVDSDDESDYEDEDSGEDQEEDETESNLEEGEIPDDGEENSDGYIDLGQGEFRERVEEFVSQIKTDSSNENKCKAIFSEMIAVGRNPNINANYQAVQILCEELGLIKCESSRKKKPLARESIIYIGKNRCEMPKQFRDFFECVVKNNDDLSCGKLLFGL